MIKPFKKNSIIYSFIGVLIVFLLWFLLYFVVADKTVVPSPLIVIKESFLTLKSGEFYSHLLNTILRVIIALVISFVLGVSLAVFASISNKFESIMLPIISIIRSLPVLAVLLIILTLMPRGFAPVAVCVLALFPIIYSQTLNNLSLIDDKQKEMLKLYNVPLKTQVFSVYLKGLTPLFIKELATSFSYSLKLVVSAEILASVYKSIGQDISHAADIANVTTLFALTLLICLIGIIVELVGKFIYFKMEKKFK